jgi:hypothetical protein
MALLARVLFGFGTITKVVDELVSPGHKRAFVLSDPDHATAAAARAVEYDFGLADERGSTRLQVEELRRQRR